MYDKIFCGNLKPSVDLDWCDPSTCVTFVSVTSKETPANTDLQEAGDIIQIEELQECNRKLFIEYSLKEAQRCISEEDVQQDTGLGEMSTGTHIPEPVDTITNVLTRKSNHFPSLKEVNKQTAETI